MPSIIKTFYCYFDYEPMLIILLRPTVAVELRLNSTSWPYNPDMIYRI